MVRERDGRRLVLLMLLLQRLKRRYTRKCCRILGLLLLPVEGRGCKG